MGDQAGHHVVGIDLGTTFSAVAHLDRHGTPVTIPNHEGDLTTPSVVMIESMTDVVVGREARQMALVEPDRVADCAKRDMGEPYYRRLINGRRIPPEAISALILKKLRQDAQARIGPIAGAVITVPAHFNDGRRQATLAAGEIAGMTVLDMIPEPTAAALAYAFQNLLKQQTGRSGPLDPDRPQHTVVYDLGGGTFDVTVLRIADRNLSVLATDGDVALGGRDWDDRIVDYIAEQFRKQHRVDPRESPASHQHLLTAAEAAKKTLSLRTATRFAVHHDGVSLSVVLRRDEVEELTADLLYRTERRLNTILSAAGMDWTQIDDVLAVGGSTRMPAVIDMLRRVTGFAPNTSLSPDEVVAHGAAIAAAMHVLQRVSTLAVPGRADAAAPRDGLAALVWDEPDAADSSGGKARSAEAKLPPPVFDDDDEDEALRLVDEDDAAFELVDTREPGHAPKGSAAEADARSAEQLRMPEAGPTHMDALSAVRDALERQSLSELASAAIPPAEESDDAPAWRLTFDDDVTELLTSITTNNVNPHSLGVVMKLDDGARFNSILIPRNAALPFSTTRRFGTVKDDQHAVSVRVVEGEAEQAEDCVLVGICRISPLPRGLRRGSTIFVTFSHDGRGHLFVKAVDARSGASAVTTIHRANTMDREALRRARQIVSRVRVV